jgi:hypothetical protein
MAPSIPCHRVSPPIQRTIKLKIAIDEEFRQRPLHLLETRKWVVAASSFFQKNFGLVFQIHDMGYWTSNNSRSSLSDLFQNLYEDVDRGENDIVLGFTGQIRGDSEVNGVASYRHGYALVKKLKNEYLYRVTIIHELCHLFGALDLENESSIMNKNEPRLECDEFTKRIVRLHVRRRFNPTVFPLSPEDMSLSLPLYIERKHSHPSETGAPLMLAIFYLEMKEYDRAIQECLFAERIVPHDPAVQRLLKMAHQQKRPH